MDKFCAQKRSLHITANFADGDQVCLFFNDYLADGDRVMCSTQHSCYCTTTIRADLGVPPPHPINDFDPGLYYCRSRVLSAQFAQCGYAPVPATFDLVECVELSHGVTFATDVRSIGLQMK